MLALFRIRIPGKWAHCAMLGTLILSVTELLHVLGWNQLIAAVQFAVIFSYFCFVLKYSWFYALLIDAIGCIITLMIMTAGNIAFAPPGQTTFDSATNPWRFLLGSAALCLTNWLLAAGLERFRLGFTFVGKNKASSHARVAIKKPMLLFLVVIAAVLIFPPNSRHLMPYLLGVVSVCLFLLLRWSLEYERKD